MRVAAVQMLIADGEPEINRVKAVSLIGTSADDDLYLLPELWSCGYVPEIWGEIADHDTPHTIEWMSVLSHAKKIWLGGSLVVRVEDGSLRNRFVLFNRQGEQVISYDKAHLFPPLLEDKYLSPGDTVPEIIDVEGVKMSPLICYDLRFPSMIRQIALKGVDLFLTVSEWPKPRKYALRVLAEARAVENQAYVLLSNRVGTDQHGNNFCGASAIIDPDGVVAELDESEGVVSGNIDVKSLHQLRKSFPVLEHRRIGIDYMERESG